MSKQTNSGNDIGWFDRALIGPFQQQVLRAIFVLGSDASAKEIRSYLERQKGKAIQQPQVYAALSRLVKLEMVTSQADTNYSAGRRGRTRQIFSLLAPGQQMLSEADASSNKVLTNHRGSDGEDATAMATAMDT